ncbi:tRNA 2-selenouridine(34) synthase MnmH [Pelomonas sp. SE-A7]|uniref:tRNA 2-selenouridine(34) synthase MnmH n=1 Tax=Pelomonas sp. SE-A7 TaxID=3054953 RepID=UPI00259CC0E3|nr:tRNA 2-selenouridine(34) synthase MnmH [Pelomonas sp. SE-A7]MDM4764791.1 tRNA 2-selenouridine(34) synthase MnmH [Pelomonas sp. SE-A7]
MSYTVTIEQALAELPRFDAIVDVRTPAEFDEDHMPGAINWPVLSNEERATVGTLYAESPFEARKLGAALVARNIARHLDESTQDLEKGWRPLVYCWRGGQRSGAMNWFLGQIGFRSRQLVGGYKAYRAQVRADLTELPGRFNYQVLCGRTGSGKTRLLQALQAEGAQTLDLEGLARHRGSVLGGLPGDAQPSQKRFDSLLWEQLRSLDADRPLWVESESRKIGRIALPEQLLNALRDRGECLWIALPDQERVQLLLEDYAHFAAEPEGFCALLEGLIELRGKETVHRWQAQARAGNWAEVFGELMRLHYDPGYERSLRNHYPQLDQAREAALDNAQPESLGAMARSLIAGLH